MSMSDDNFKMLEAHLRAHKISACPACKGIKYSADGPYEVQAVGTRPVPLFLQVECFHVVMLTCVSCFFLRQFAWIPIVDAAEKLVKEPL